MNQSKYNTVLLIDDDQITNRVNEKILKEINFAQEVVIKDSGASAIAYIKDNISKKLPEIIFLDLIMPEVDGFEFLKSLDQLVKDGKHNWQSENCKIVVLSSSADDSEITRATFNPYIYRYLVKPLKVKSLEDIGL